MDVWDHELTSSYGSWAESRAYRTQVGEMIRDGEWRRAMATEIRDVRRAAFEGSGNQTKYNQAIWEMLDYAGWLRK
jgi:hypothetical protein